MKTDIDDVLVVGAGPTGLIAAIFLRLHGVERVRIIEALETPSRWAKAVGIQPRSLEILRQVGGTVLEELLDHGSLTANLSLYDYTRKETLVRTNFNTIKNKAFTGALLNEQWHSEQVYEKRLKELGVSVERGKTLKSLYDNTQQGYVEVVLGISSKSSSSSSSNSSSSSKQQRQEEEVEEETLKVRYVIGCDGAHSFVRHHLGLNFEGEKDPRSYALIHAMIDDMPVDNRTVRIHLGNDGWAFVSPMADGSWICIFDLTDDDRAKCSPHQPNLDDLCWLLSSRGITGVEKAHSPLWQTYFNIHSRLAERYSVGHLFLCGDAGHIHSPLGGQGMNMGIQDAHNLAWKLALVIRGEAGESLLDSYHTERHEIDKYVLRFIERVHANVSNRDSIPRFFLNTAIKTISSQQFILDAVLVPRIGQQVYNYRFSPLSIESWGRIPLPRYVLHRRSQNILRIAGRRMKAGDRVPDFPLNLHGVFVVASNSTDKSSSIQKQRQQPQRVQLHEWLNGSSAGMGFKALIFESLPRHNLPSDKDDVYVFGEELLKASCGLISNVAVVPVKSNNNDNDYDEEDHADNDNDDELHVYKKFGIHGQCLMLIRPDGYIGLRLEPLSINLTLSYLADVTKATKVRGHGAAVVGTTGPDPVPKIVLSTVLTAIGFFGYKIFSSSKGKGNYRDAMSPYTMIVGSSLLLFAGCTLTEVKRDW